MPDGATPPATRDAARPPARLPAPSAGPAPWLRQLCHLVPVGLLTAFGGIALVRTIPPTHAMPALFDLLCLLNLALLAHGAWHSVLGYALTLLPARLGARPFELAAATPSGRARTAVLVPVFAEDPARVAAAVGVMRRSFAGARAGRIDLFVLSDTRDDGHAAVEQAALTALPADGVDVFYRRRPVNTRRKAGNIAEWCERWGGSYDFMVVLDADSLIGGRAVDRLVGLMEAHPRAGMIQAMCWPVGHGSLFARVLQAGSRLYSSLSVRGLAFWQGPRGAWWGHNAIIRTAAFMRHCCLPDLPGRAPLGGEILCHDTIEAALMARAGWGVWLVTDVEASYEEVPTNLVDFLVRERRWCQGNLQHAGVLARADGLPVASWLHILGGFLHYATAPLSVLLFALLVFGGDLLGGGTVVEGGPGGIDWGWSLGTLTLGLMFVPKLLSLALVLRTPGAVRRYGGLPGLLLSLVAEQVFGLLLGPVILLFVVIFVTGILAGRSVAWGAQNRNDRGLGWGEAWRRLGWPTLAGAAGVTGLTMWAGASWLAWGFLPGLLLAVPFAVCTGRSTWGRAAARAGLFVTPDETAPSPELAALAAAIAAPPRDGGALAGHPGRGLATLPPEAPGEMEPPAGFRRSRKRVGAALPGSSVS